MSNLCTIKHVEKENWMSDKSKYKYKTQVRTARISHDIVCEAVEQYILSNSLYKGFLKEDEVLQSIIQDEVDREAELDFTLYIRKEELL